MGETHEPVPERLQSWLARAVQEGASDLHLTVGYPPALRLHGDLTELPEDPLEGEELDQLLGALCPADGRDRLRDERDADFSIQLSLDGEPARFRTHLFFAGGHLGGCLRVIPTE